MSGVRAGVTAARATAAGAGTGVTVRGMRWWDVAAAAALEAERFGDPWSAAMFWSELAGVPATRYYVVAERGEQLVGYAGLFSSGADADVQVVAVAVEEEGSGLGTRLLGALLGEARARGCSRVTLEVRVDNVRAQALYARHGFVRVGVRRGYYPPDGADALVLQTRLDRSALDRSDVERSDSRPGEVS